MSRKRPTQADVARLAGVSQATVSYVLNNSAAISVPDETRRRILEAVETLGYEPDRVAQTLRTRKTYTLACIIPDIANPFYPAFARGVQDVAERSGYDLILYNTDGLADREQKCLRSVRQGRADGVIAVLFHTSARELFTLLDMGIAIVRLESTPKDAGPRPLDNLFLDNTAAAEAAVSYLLDAGHTRIGMIAGTLDTPPRELRIRGYRQALARRRLLPDVQLIRSGDFREEGGEQAMRELLRLPRRPTAVFAANDLMAIGALVAARDAGVRVPEDVAVVGFDDIPAARVVTPPLTTIAQHPDRMGQRAAEMVFERLDGRAPAHGRVEAAPFELVIRQSA
ncbi:MAG: LacI family DNA-binding transcriptional regulator [Chloroflexi bacterium]|nr:LacI family DNA-binding transcriptional regulator [Chloroflexota bacterium]